MQLEEVEGLQYIGFGRNSKTLDIIDRQSSHECDEDKDELYNIINRLKEKYGVQELMQILKNWL